MEKTTKFEVTSTLITAVCADIMMTIMMFMEPSWFTFVFLCIFGVITWFALSGVKGYQIPLPDIEEESLDDINVQEYCYDEDPVYTVWVPQVKVFNHENVNDWIVDHLDEIRNIGIATEVINNRLIFIVIYEQKMLKEGVEFAD